MSDLQDKQQDCIEKCKLNIAMCCIKLEDNMGCISACQEILNVPPLSSPLPCSLAAATGGRYRPDRPHPCIHASSFNSQRARLRVRVC